MRSNHTVLGCVLSLRLRLSPDVQELELFVMFIPPNLAWSTFVENRENCFSSFLVRGIIFRKTGCYVYSAQPWVGVFL